MPTHTFTTANLPFHPSPKSTKTHHVVTSVAGHVYNVDFPSSFQSWDTTSPEELFSAPTVKKPTKGSLLKHLQTCWKDCDFLVLWMDCDREGENINFEVLTCLSINNDDSWSRVYRARFSAVAKSDILKAYGGLVKPDQLQALSVDARQEVRGRIQTGLVPPPLLLIIPFKTWPIVVSGSSTLRSAAPFPASRRATFRADTPTSTPA